MAVDLRDVLGARIIEAVRLAAAMHRSAELRRQGVPIGGADRSVGGADHSVGGADGDEGFTDGPVAAGVGSSGGRRAWSFWEADGVGE